MMRVRWRKVVNKPDWVTEAVMELVGVEGDVRVFVTDDRKKVRIRPENLVNVEPAI